MNLLFYQNIIYALISLTTLLYVAEYSVKKKRLLFQDVLCFIFIFCYSFVFANRVFSVYSDTGMYEYQYSAITSFSDIFSFRGDYLFYFMFYIFKTLSFDFKLVLFFISLIFNALIYLAVRKLFSHFYFFLFFIIVSLFFYYGMITNIMRQGLAFAFFFYAFACLKTNEMKKFYLAIIISLGMHLSFLLPIGLLFVTRFIRSLTLPLVVFILSSILSVMNLKVLQLLETVPLVSSLFKNRTDFDFIYYDDYKVGFRPDFFVFNCIFLLVGLITYNKIKHTKIKEFYMKVLTLFILLSSYFFLMFPYPFSDRYGVMSWMFIPLLFLPYIRNEIKIPFINLFTIYIFFLCIYITFNVILFN